MLKISETRNVSGQVMIGEGENSKQVAYLNASVSKDGNVNINKSIQDSEIFKTNKEAVLKDFTEFETEAEAESFCREYGWEWVDENEFVWDMDYEEA